MASTRGHARAPRHRGARSRWEQGAPRGRCNRDVLAGTAALHVAWGRGSTWPFADHRSFVRSVLGRERGAHGASGAHGAHAASMPGAGPSFAVAALLGIAAGSVATRPRAAGSAPLMISELATVTTAAVLGARGVGGLVISATGVPTTTPEFRRHNLRVYSPLCLALALGARRARRA